jgi:hypothetical protein
MSTVAILLTPTNAASIELGKSLIFLYVSHPQNSTSDGCTANICPLKFIFLAEKQ